MKTIISVVWAELTTVQRALVLGVVLIIGLLASLAVFTTVRTFSHSNILKAMIEQQIEAIDRERHEKELIIKMLSDSLISRDEAIILRDNRIKILNDELNDLAASAQEIPLFVASLDSVGIINELTRIRATYHLD